MGEIIGTNAFGMRFDTEVNVPSATLIVVVHPTLRFRVICTNALTIASGLCEVANSVRGEPLISIL
jgi:hypothetical protein